MPLPPDPSPALQSYAHPERLVTADWLSGNLGRPGLAIVESDEDVLLYDIGYRFTDGLQWSERSPFSQFFFGYDF